MWPAVATAGIVIVGLGLMVWAPWQTQTPALQAIRFPVAETDSMKFFYGGAMAVSPDGRWMVFPAVEADGVARYWVRSLETVEARALPGTETAFVPAAWSADSRHVIFSAGSSEIKRIDIQGGPPQTLSRMDGRLNGLADNGKGAMIFGTSPVAQPLFRIASGGGAPVAITAVSEGEVAHKFPQFLPDGHRFLYLRASADPAKAGVYVGDIDRTPAEQSRERVLATNRQAYFAASPDGGRGHLIYLRDTTLMAQPFDPDRLELSGDAVPIAEKRRFFSAQFYGLFSVSNNGTLVYREGLGSTLALTWFDQNGKLAGVFGEPGDYANPVMSPDQSRIAVARGPAGARDIWIVDIARGSSTRLTFDPANDDNPVWSPDSTDIVFSSDRSGVRRMYLKPSDGSGDERLLTDQLGIPSSWSKDGRFLLFTSAGRTTGGDLWALPIPVASLATASPSSFFRLHSWKGMRSSPPTAAGLCTRRTNRRRTTCTCGRFPQMARRARLGRNGSSPDLAAMALCTGIPTATDCSTRTARPSISWLSISTRAKDSRPVLHDLCSGLQRRSSLSTGASGRTRSATSS